MRGTIRVDHINKNIMISKTFARASMVINSEEYKTLSDVKSTYGEYSIIQREIRKNPQKESYRGLTYAYTPRKRAQKRRHDSCNQGLYRF